jgi:transcriptional regulator with XRE-family HTH domain
MTQQQLADRFSVTPGRISQYKKQGMPVTSLEAAEAWLAQNVSRDNPRDLELPAESLPPDMGPRARLYRAQEGERRHFALWEAAVARQPVNTREVSELATSWREMRKGASEAEKEYAAYLAVTRATISTPEAVKAMRDLLTAIVQDFSTRPWGDEATRMMHSHLSSLPSHLRAS